MNRFFLIIFLLLSQEVLAQKRHVTDKGEIDFISNAELELIKASSAKVRGIIDPATNQFAFTVDIESFKGFNSALQREHFLDKYMEIHRYPKAEFSGKIIEQVDFKTSGVYHVRAKGVLSIHGEDQIRIIKCKVTIKDDVIKLESEFTIPLSDHNIAIPSIVSRKIATEIDVIFKAIVQ